MKKYALLFVLLTCNTPLFYGNAIIKEAEAAIMQKDYSRARTILIEGLRDTDLTPLKRAEILGKLAWFYEELAGNSEEALRYYRRIVELQCDPDSEVVRQTIRTIQRLEQDKIDFHTENSLITVVRMETSNKNEAAFRISQLKRLIRNTPGFPDIALAYYYLGIHYMVLEKYSAAYDSFKKAFTIKPALDFVLPINNKMELSLEKHLSSLARNLSYWCLALITILSISLFIGTKPWQWIRVWHLVMLLCSFVVCAGMLLIINWLMGSSLSSTSVTFEQPAFFNNTPGGPGSQPFFLFFLYLLPGFFIVFIFTAAVSRFSPAISMRCISGLAAFLVLTAVSTIFYFDVCMKPGIFEPAQESYFSYTGGKIYFRQPDIEPYILTNPRLYQDLTLDNLDEHIYSTWINKQYRIIKQTDGREEQ